MEFQNYIRNEYGKCDVPSNTIKRIKDGLHRLGLEVEYYSFQVSENIFWGRVWIDSIKIVCNGKGITPELAEASAYAELAERLSAGLFYPVFEEQVRFNVPGLYNGETQRFLNYEWMEGYVYSHQDDLETPLRIEDLLANETHLKHKDIRELKNCKLAKNWVDGFSVVHEKTIKVPVNFVSYIHGSNGIAAGNTIEEAMIQATCEVFERYSQIQTIKFEKIMPSIDLDSIENEIIRRMIRFYQGKNVDVIIKDLSLDGLIPCIGVLFINNNLRKDRLEHRILIPGVSFNLEEALTRCFTESMQGRETLLTARPELDTSVVHRSLVNDYYMLMKCSISLKDISFLDQGETRAYKNIKINDVLGEIEEIKRICEKFNTDYIILNHTHPILNFPVVRVVIPGISDFLPFLRQDVLISGPTRPPATWRGEEFKQIMQSFFT
jgi:YcaO-like protein with predicted kinase domain